ncbi:MAG: hypothetical protein ACE5HF_07640 [Gemmatimonadota bacterium]
MSRIASVLVDAAAVDPTRTTDLTVALLAGSPRVAVAGPGLRRVDAGGWGRRGGEEALAHVLCETARSAGFPDVLVGVADVAVASDAAARLAGRPDRACGFARRGPGTVIVAPGAARPFLAPLPLGVLPLDDDMREILRALGFLRVGDLAARARSELEARFGPAGLRAHRLACGEDGRVFAPVVQESHPEASLDLDVPVETLEPLLFVLRHLLGRICADLTAADECAARLAIVLTLDDGKRREAAVTPARATRHERLLYDLCRAALERAAGADGRLPARIDGIVLRVERLAPAGVRQGELFSGDWRDPLAAAAVLSRLRARLGDAAVEQPAPRSDHRPETRNAWEPVRVHDVSEPPGEPPPRAATRPSDALPGALRLLPEPVAVRVRTKAGRPVRIENGEGARGLVAAEGPERLSGDWWRGPYHREYFRVCTSAGELLWLYREPRMDADRAGDRWWLHGWWD